MMSMCITRARLVTGVLVAGALAPAAAHAANGDWSTRTLTEQLDAYRHDRAWHGDLLASL